MKIATWNVNGVRARQANVQEWIERERPDVVCLLEIKAGIDQLPVWLCEIDGYWCYWHGGKGYSGVALHVSKTFSPDRPALDHPTFDYEHRIVQARLPQASVVSVYVPNGGKDFPAKMRFLAELDEFAADLHAESRPVVICGDLNIARTEIDVHPKERKPNAIGQLPEERALFERILSQGLVDIARKIYPDNAELFTWWAPWRILRQRNIGWRIDYILASEALAARARSFESQREFGTSDHAPVVTVFE